MHPDNILPGMWIAIVRWKEKRLVTVGGLFSPSENRMVPNRTNIGYPFQVATASGPWVAGTFYHPTGETRTELLDLRELEVTAVTQAFGESIRDMSRKGKKPAKRDSMFIDVEDIPS